MKTFPDSDLKPEQPLRQNDQADRSGFHAHTVQEFRDETATLFSKAMAQTQMAVILVDAHSKDMPIVFANRAFSELTGYEPEEILGRNCRFLQGPDTDPDAVRRMRSALRNEETVVLDLVNYRKNGERFWNALHLAPLYDEEGGLQYYIGSQWDVTEVHAARADEKHAQMLSRELSHRVKNMFSVVSAVVTMTAEHHDAPALAKDINDRIFALGQTFDITLRTPPDEEVGIRTLVGSILEHYAAGDGQVLEMGGPNLTVPMSHSSVVGLILHELATNAVKHGAFRTRSGTISVGWSVADMDDEQVLELAWQERSPGPISAPDHAGTGTGIIQDLLDASEGKIERHWTAEGLRATIYLPF